MSGDFMENVLTLWVVFAVAVFPFQTVYAVAKLLAKMAGTDLEHLPEGCGIAAAVLIVATLIAAPFLGWWCYHNFHVVWK